MPDNCEYETLRDANGICSLSGQTQEKCDFRNNDWCYYVEAEAQAEEEDEEDL